MVHAMALSFDPIDEARRNWEQQGWGAVASMAAATSITRAHQILLGRIDAVLSPLGLNFSRFEAIALLAFTRAGELPLGKMGERLQVHPASVTNTIDRPGSTCCAPHRRSRHAGPYHRNGPPSCRSGATGIGRHRLRSGGHDPGPTGPHHPRHHQPETPSRRLGGVTSVPGPRPWQSVRTNATAFVLTDCSSGLLVRFWGSRRGAGSMTSRSRAPPRRGPLGSGPGFGMRR